MATTTHKITALRSGSANGVDWEAEHTITFTYTPGTPPTSVDPGSGATLEFATVDFVKVEPEADAPTAFQDIAQQHLNDWAEGWLQENEDEAMAVAVQDRDADADEYADRQRRARIDDNLTGDL